MKKTFELLKKKGLRSPESVEKYIMDKYSLKEILKLNRELLETVDTTDRASNDLSVFNFVGDSDMTAQHTGCVEWRCRLSRIAETAKFAGLYCDTLYISNYFDDYPSPDLPGVLEPRLEIKFRYDYVGDLKILLALKPLLEEGIVKLIKPGFHFCKTCTKKLLGHSLTERIDHVVDFLTDEYIKLCRVRLVPNEDPLTQADLAFSVKGPKDLYEKGGVVEVPLNVPRWLLRKSGFHKTRTRKRAYLLTQGEMRKVEIPRNDVKLVARDILFQHIASLLMDTKYLTRREIDVKFLSAITTNPQFREYNDVLKSELLCRIPIFDNVPLKTILTLRKKEREAFLVFRNTIAKVISEYLKQRKPFAKADARGIYEDVIYPELCKLNAKAKNLKTGAILKSVKDVFITSGVLSFGLFSGLLPTNLKGIFTAVGGFHLSRELINSITSILHTSNEIRNHNFFFLWRLSRKLPKHSHR